MKSKLIDVKLLQISLLLLTLALSIFIRGFNERYYLFLPTVFLSTILSYVLKKNIFKYQFISSNEFHYDFKDILLLNLIIFTVGTVSGSYYYLMAALIAVIGFWVFRINSKIILNPILLGMTTALFFGDVMPVDQELLMISFKNYLFWFVIINSVFFCYLRKSLPTAATWLITLFFFKLTSAFFSESGFSFQLSQVLNLENVLILFFFGAFQYFSSPSKLQQIYFGVSAAALSVIFSKLNISHHVLLSVFIVSAFFEMFANQIPKVIIKSES